MKAITIATIASILIISVLFAGASLRARANPNPTPAPPTITITYSPDFWTSSMILRIHITVGYDYNNCTRQAWYSLDGQGDVSIPLVYQGMTSGSYPYSTVTGETRLPPLEQGNHTIKVSAKYNYGDFVLTGSKTETLWENQNSTTSHLTNQPIVSFPLFLIIIVATASVTEVILLIYRRRNTVKTHNTSGFQSG